MKDLHYLDRIRENYDDYLRDWKQNQGIISFGEDDDYDFPLVRSARTDTSIKIGRLESEIERCYLSTYYDSIPAPHEMSTELLERLPIELVKLLRIQNSEDNVEYCKYSHSIFRDLANEVEFIARETWDRIEILFHLILCEKTTLGFGHCSQIIQRRHSISSFVAYPALEGLLCDLIPTIQLDGVVIEEDSIRNFRGGGGDYYSSGQRCSRLTDLLIHYEEEIASHTLEQELEAFRENIEIFGEYGSNRVYKMLFEWRNSVVHAEEFAFTQSEIILLLVCMILWNRINELGKE